MEQNNKLEEKKDTSIVESNEKPKNHLLKGVLIGMAGILVIILVTVMIFSKLFSGGAPKPVVKQAKPINNATEVSTTGEVQVEFENEIKKGEKFDDISITDENGDLVDCEVLQISNKIILKPKNPLNSEAYYTVTIPKDSISNNDNIGIEEDYTLTFQTKNDEIAVTNTFPCDGQENVPINAAIKITFNKAVVIGDNFEAIALKNSQNDDVEITKSISKNELIIKPKYELDINSIYSIQIPVEAIKSEYGTGIKDEVTLSFTTSQNEETSSEYDSSDNYSTSNNYQAAKDSSYILQDSSSRKLTSADLKGMTKNYLRLARNEIFARYGYVFGDPSLQTYFETKSWYTGNSSFNSDYMYKNVLSDIERYNVNLIKKLEAKK